MKSHKNNHELPKIMASHRFGSILNILNNDNVCKSLETWFIAQVYSEVAIIEKSYFE
jgi:hypothetical protein